MTTFVTSNGYGRNETTVRRSFLTRGGSYWQKNRDLPVDSEKQIIISIKYPGLDISIYSGKIRNGIVQIV